MARDEGNSGRSGEYKGTAHREFFPGNQSARNPVSGSLLTTGALIGVASLFAPELLVGMALGAGIAMASNWVPDLVGGVLRPVVKTTIKAGYSAARVAREMVSEASESVSDVVAEVRAESGETQS